MSTVEDTGVDVGEDGVIRTIAPNDWMTDKVKPENYFIAGRSALKAILVSLEAARVDPASVTRILDLPCGHGRVLRHLRAGFPAAEIAACDIDRDGVDFCARTFGATPIYSRDDPAEIPL